MSEQHTYCDWYRTERPHQGRACGNRPPAEAFPELPVLPAVPAQVDADGWLQQIDGWTFVRRVNAQGKLVLDGGSRLTAMMRPQVRGLRRIPSRRSAACMRHAPNK